MEKTKRDHLLSIVQEFDTGVLVTRTPAGDLRGRPMGLAEVEADGSLYFCASVKSEKLAELVGDAHVAVAFQSKTKFASLSGVASVDKDRATIRRLWREAWKIWFPVGSEDPDLCLIRVDPTEGEYWDNSGARGVKFVIDAAKAYLSGERLVTSENENAKVRL